MKTFIILLCLLYVANIFLKFLYYTFKIAQGNRLKQKLDSNDRSKITQLYPSIDEYCKKVHIKALPDAYGVPPELINKNSPQARHRLSDSIDETIGTYRFRRGYCYILFTIKNDEESRSTFKILVDAIIKVATTIVVKFLEFMISN